MAVENDHNCECSVCAERYAQLHGVAAKAPESLAAILDHEEDYLVDHLTAECGLMSGDIEGSFHRIREALATPQPAPTQGDATPNAYRETVRKIAAAREQRLAELIEENARLRALIGEPQPPVGREALQHTIAKHIACEKDCQTQPSGCGCARDAANAIALALTRPHRKTEL